MDVSYDVTASLQANMKHHEPLVLVFDARGNGGVSSHLRLQEIIKTESRTTRR